MNALSEQDLIKRYLAPLAGPGGLGLADDTALLPQEPGFDWVINTDMLIESVHFLNDPPDTIAAKALRVNLSDLAAKGAEPVAYCVALGLNKTNGEDWVASFAEGLARDQKRFNIQLIGGDTNRTDGPTTIAVTAFGRLPSGTMVTRAGARPGDRVLVSGTIGDAAMGLLVARGELGLERDDSAEHFLTRYRLPDPRVHLAEPLRRYASASIDVSDGFAGDLAKLCAASELGADIQVVKVPLSAEMAKHLERTPSLLERILTGGDDYEILATVSPGSVEAFVAAAQRAGVTTTEVGRMKHGGSVPVLNDSNGQAMAFSRSSFDHFAESDRS